MTSPSDGSTIGVLASGGLDSCVLLTHLLGQGHRVRPFYVRCGLLWEREEERALHAFLLAVASTRLEALVVLDLPLRDLYGEHWSINGRETPDARSPDDAVYLPGRNALLALKPALWCGMHGIERLATAVLDGNPFSDATDEFFCDFEKALLRATDKRVSIVRPFVNFKKKDLMRLGDDVPLELTFSCIAPVNGLHCGRCNKCAERQHAFAAAGVADATKYATKQ